MSHITVKVVTQLPKLKNGELLAIVVGFGCPATAELEWPVLDSSYRCLIEKSVERTSAGDVPTLYPSFGEDRGFHIGIYNQKNLEDVPGDEALRITGRRIAEAMQELRASKCYVVANPREHLHPDSLACIAEGMILGSYKYDRFQRARETPSLHAEFVVPSRRASAIRASIKKSLMVATLQNAMRDLINEPPSFCGPARFIRAARSLAQIRGVTVQILNAKHLKKGGYVGVCAVGSGAEEAPAMIILRYRGGKRGESPLAYVGKAVMFDTGGYCLKPPKDMWRMKGDMAGGAAVLGAVVTIAKLQLPVNVIGIIPCAKNLISAKAYLPGDVITFKNGKSVHITNTDAEGRLLLADALIRAGEEKARTVIDVATLTGAVVRALGPAMAGVMGNSEELVARVIKAGLEVGEHFWELPLVAEYKKQLKSDVADLENVGKSPDAGAIVGGLFLQEFVPSGAQWAHLDIAGPFFTEKSWRYYDVGATGFGLRTLVKFAEHFCGVGGR